MKHRLADGSWTRFAVLCVALAASVVGAFSAAAYEYTSAQTVSAVLADGVSPASVTVNASLTYDKFVSFTGDNTYTGGTFLRKGNISVDHVNALGTSGEIHCSSGTTVRVTVSYRAAGTTLKAALLDRIVVDAPAAGEPWVAIKLDGEGLKNDVDFSGQPYLWLCSSSPVQAQQSTLVGLYEPCGDTYRFGYSGNRPGTSFAGICVTNLTDAADGTPRNVLCRGKGSTSFCYSTGRDKSLVPALVKVNYSGTFTAEDDAFVADTNAGATDFGTCTAATATNKITLRNGAYWTHHGTSHTFPANCGIVLGGAVTWYHSGADNETHMTYLGSVSGSGTLTLLDKGGEAFCGTNNTFGGKVVVNGTYGGIQRVIIGNGTNFSWGDATIDIVKDDARREVYLNSNFDVDFNGQVTSANGYGGAIVKQGAGVITLKKENVRSRKDDGPVFRIERGGIRRTVEERTVPMRGPIELQNGAVFDLNHVPAESVYVPVGEGKIVNPANGAMTLVGTLAGERDFTGVLDGAVTLRLLGGVGDTLRICGTSDIEEKLTVESGTVALNGPVSLPSGVDLAADAALAIGSTNAMPYLRAELILNQTSRIGRDVTTPIADQFWYSLTNSLTPNRVMDTSAFNRCGNGSFCSYKFAQPPEMTAKEYRALLPYEQMVGGVDMYDNFILRFKGVFRAEKAGTYAFRGKADDKLGLFMDGQPVFFTDANYREGAIELTEGYHDFCLIFIDMTMDEYFWFDMKAPGESSWHGVPLGLLSHSKGSMNLGPVTGTGMLTLAENGCWPATDFSGFTGRVIPNDNTASDDTGVLALGTATVDFSNPWDCGGANWNVVGTDGTAGRIESETGVSYQLNKGANGSGHGALNSAVRVPMDRPWTFSFDMQLEKMISNIGDGIFIGLQNDGPAALATSWNFNFAGTDKAYGLQAYIMSSQTPLNWVNGNASVSGKDGVLGKPVTNTTFLAGNKIKDYGLHVEMRWNCAADTGTNLVMTLSSNGESWTSTNTQAAADLKTKFATAMNGQGLYLCVRAKDGAFYARKVVSNVRFDDGTTAPEQTFGSTLRLTGGTVTVAGNIDKTGTVGGALDVVGAARLSVAKTNQSFDFSSTNWSFSVDGTLTFGPGIDLSELGTVRVSVPRGKESRCLADFTELGDVTLPQFVIDDPKLERRIVFEVRGGKLYADFINGMLLLVR